MKVKDLKYKKDNPRKINPEDLDKLKASIRDFPKMMELRPMVYDPETMEVLGGNMRLRAIRELDMKEIPDSWVKSADDFTEKEKQRFVIQDNVSGGEWDMDILMQGLPDSKNGARRYYETREDVPRYGQEC